MFILTKNKLDTNEIHEIQNTLISKKTVSRKDSLIIDNPKHLNLITDFNISNYNHLYEVVDYIVKENENLFNYIKDKDFEYIIKTLTNTHEDNAYAKEVLSYIISNNLANTEFLTEAANMLQNLVNEIYFNNKTSPGYKIAKLREYLNKKESLTDVEKLELKILKNRATRWTLLKAFKNITTLNSILVKGFDFTTISDALENQHYYIYLSEKEYLTIFSKIPGSKCISTTDLFTGYRYRSLKDLKDGSAVNYKKLKHIYIASNNYILKKLSYSDFLNSEESAVALNNMLKGFKDENIDTLLFDADFLEKVIADNHEDIKNTIYEKFMNFVDEDLKPLFTPDKDSESENQNSSDDVLSFISKMYKL